MSSSHLPQTTSKWILRSKPSNTQVSADNFEYVESAHLFSEGEPTEGKILVKVLYLSNDPAQRTWMSGDKFNHRPYLGDVMVQGQTVWGGAVCQVVESWNGEYQKGEFVFAYAGWTEYAVLDPKTMVIPITKIPPMVDPSDWLALDLVAQTAYLALLDCGGAHSGMDTIVVSSAAGGVGYLVCQIAKRVLGIKNVVGIAGTDEKCQKLLEKGWVDVALNYKSADFEQQLVEATPKYIDCYFDNVGQKMLDLMLLRMKDRGTIIACGAIAAYEGRDDAPMVSAGSWMQIIYRNLTVKGFILTQWIPQIPKVYGDIFTWMAEGKVEVQKTILKRSLKEQPEAYRVILEGGNFGKTITQIAERD